MDYLSLVSAILTANLLTAWFLWGMSKAFKIGEADTPTWPVLGAMLFPLAFAGLGFYLAA